MSKGKEEEKERDKMRKRRALAGDMVRRRTVVVVLDFREEKVRVQIGY